MPDIFDELDAPTEKSPSLLKKATGVGAQALSSAATGFAGSYGDLLSLIGLSPKATLAPGQKALYQAEFNAPESQLPFLQDEDILPRYHRFPTSEEVSERIEKTPQNKAERYAQRIGKSAGSGAAFGGGGKTLKALSGASAIGQTAKELGAPEGIATTLELLSLFGPQALAKHVAGSKKLNEFISYARRKGLSETEIAGLVQGQRKTKALAKLAKKGGKTEQILNSIDSKAGNAIDQVRERAAKLPMLSGETSGQLADSFGEIAIDLGKTIKPSPDKESAINFIRGAQENLMNQGASPEMLINFWQDINNAVNWKAIKGGKKALASLKKPLMNTLSSVDPDLAKDFSLANTLYARSKQLVSALKPSLVDQVLDKGPVGVGMMAFALGNPNIIGKYISANAVRTLGREMLFNPRFQNISRKILNALKEDKPKAAQSLLKGFRKELKEEHPDIFDELEKSGLF
jgi:hypothetical protein